MSDAPTYDVAVVGGGPAGLTAALYTTRLGHRTAVLDGEGGRHESVARVHNLMGVSSETSGAALSQEAIDQFVVHGGDYYPDEVTGIERTDTDPLRFSLTAERADVTAFRIVLATGFVDEPPGVPGLDAFTGRGLHYCLHCDAYTLGDEPVYVLGHDDHAAAVAMMLLNLTGSVDLLLNGAEPTWCDDVGRQVSEHPLAVHEQAVVGRSRTNRPRETGGSVACDSRANGSESTSAGSPSTVDAT